jgi:hypothetical protein
MRLVFGFAASGVAAAACAASEPSLPREHGVTPTAAAVSAESPIAPLAAKTDTRVRLHGKAAQTKSGAALVTDSGDVVYLEGVDAWPDDAAGRNVTATGVLVRRKAVPDPVVDDAGAVSQGAEGMQLMLEGAHWTSSP